MRAAPRTGRAAPRTGPADRQARTAPRHAAPAAAILAAGALSLLFACRDGPKPFEPEVPPPPDPPTWRLTFNPGQDHAPSWSPASDSVYYAAEELFGLPDSAGVLMRVAVERGPATPLFPALQSDRSYRWSAPAVAAQTKRVAFMEVTAWGRTVCGDEDFCELAEDTVPSEAPVGLRSLVLRVRPAGATGPLDADPRLLVTAPGVRYDATLQHDTTVGAFVVEVFPFQTLFKQSRLPVFRPSWSGDGQRLAFADGQRLWVWTPGAADATPLAGTTDAAWAAWRPGSDVIVFTRYARDGGTPRWCFSRSSTTARVTCHQLQISYANRGAGLATIRADGSGYAELGAGEEPAWSVDGAKLYFRRDDQLWQANADGSGATTIAGTTGGHEPAPSPDGRYLAFTRASTTNGTFDVWITTLAAR